LIKEKLAFPWKFIDAPGEACPLVKNHRFLFRTTRFMFITLC